MTLYYNMRAVLNVVLVRKKLNGGILEGKKV
jgi:hypothetical protein